LLRLFGEQQVKVRRAALRLLEISGLPSGPNPAVDRAAKTAADRQADPELRADSIGLLAIAGPDAHEAMLKALVDPHEPDPVQAAAVRALGRIKGDVTGEYLLAQWRTLTPSGRTEAAD